MTPAVPLSAEPAVAPAGDLERLTAVMAVSRAVAEGKALEDTLATIARTGASMAASEAAAIILRPHETATGLAVAGSYGLSERYADELNRIRPIEMGHGPSGLAASRRRPLAVSDVLADPVFEPWRNLAVREHYRAMVSVPLQLGSARRVIGVLNAYRRLPGEWSREQLDLLVSLADHAAIAIQTAQLLNDSRRQVHGLSMLVRSLRTQSHEHANLLHALHGLLALEEVEQARELIGSADERFETTYARVTRGIENTVVAGFLLSETAIAGNGGIDLKIVRGSRLVALPPRVSELDAITVIGNLIHNAIDAVADMPRRRRRVSARISDRDGGLLVRVRDWGPGIPEDAVADALRPGRSTKPDHAGVGLSLVRSIVARAHGELSVEQPAGPGVEVVVRIPG